MPRALWPKIRGQRCWVHKTAKVLNKLPKSQQPKATRALQVSRKVSKAALAPFLVAAIQIFAAAFLGF